MKIIYNGLLLTLVSVSLQAAIGTDAQRQVEAIKEEYAKIKSVTELIRHKDLLQSTLPQFDKRILLSAQFVEDNSKNAIGQKDSIIMQPLKELLDAHIKMVNLVKLFYNKAAGIVALSDNAEALRNQIDKTLTNIKQPNGPVDKLLNGRTTLDRKKAAILVLRELGEHIKLFATKVSNSLAVYADKNL